MSSCRVLGLSAATLAASMVADWQLAALMASAVLLMTILPCAAGVGCASGGWRWIPLVRGG